jgi:voltage-gated potassium channel
MARRNGPASDRVDEATGQAEQAARQLTDDARARERTRRRVGEYLDLPASLAAVLIAMLVLLQLSARVQPAWQNESAVLLWFVWAIFIAEFLTKVVLAPAKGAYLATHRRQLLEAVVPVVAIVRLVGPFRNLLIGLIHLVLPTSPAMHPYIAALKKRKLGQLALVSAMVILIGATAEWFFEAGVPGASITSFGAAVWWSAATATTVANQLYPVTPGGEVVGFLIMVYAVCVFGYLASSLASVLIAGDARRLRRTGEAPPDDGPNGPTPSDDEDSTIHLSDQEIQVLRAILARLERQ